MLISSGGRYCLQVMIDLAAHAGQGYIPLKEIAQLQGLSMRYLVKILPALAKNKIIVRHPGKGGGYCLSREAEEYTLGEILRLAEGTLGPVVCVECGTESDTQTAVCSTLPVWTELDRRINEYLDSITLDELLE